jgi:hypothetical protein
MPFTPLPAFAIDQVLSPMALNTIQQNARDLYVFMDRRHGITSGEHDDERVARAKGRAWYEGTFGAGGVWRLDEGVNCTIGNLPGDTVGRGRVTFASVFAGGLLDAVYAVITSPFYRAAGVPGAGEPALVPWFNRATASFDFSYRFLSGGTTWTEASTNLYGFSFEVYGRAAPIA